MRAVWGLAAVALSLLAAASGGSAATTADCGPPSTRIDESPAWAPDGSRLAFVRRDVFECPDVPWDVSVQIVNPDGSDEHAIFGFHDSTYGLSWSSDGRHLAFVRYTQDGPVLQVLDATDGHSVLSVPVTFCCSGPPTWSPDGTRIALGTVIVDVASGHVRNPLIPTTGAASWSPDSRRIAYLGPQGLEVAAADGSSRQWIGPGGASTGTVYWSPQGTWIAYQITREFRFVRPDGSGFVEMPDEGLLLGWRPDSQAVLDYVPEDQRLLAIDKGDGHAESVGWSKLRPESFSWPHLSAAYIGSDLCPRDGVFVKPAGGAAARVSNDCIIRGTPGSDRLIGTSLPDVILGGGGNDRIYGEGGDDIAFGGAGNDIVSAETVTGGPGRDVLIAGSDPRWPAIAVHARDGQRDVIRCPLGQWPGPTITADRIDRIASRCYGT